MPDQAFPFHDESTALAHAPADRVFAYLDDPKSLSAHMGESSMMMLGSRMSMDVDADGGRAIGSKIRMHGSMMNIPLSLEEVITERQAPCRKVWETIGTPNLLVMAHYRMGFEVTPSGDSSRVRVFIDYSLPTSPPGSWLGRSMPALTHVKASAQLRSVFISCACDRLRKCNRPVGVTVANGRSNEVACPSMPVL